MARRRYRYDEEKKEMVEVTEDWQPTPRVEIMSGRFYEGTRATDGTPIDTRARHAAYLKATGSAMATDFKSIREKEGAKREAIRNGTYKTKEARQATEAAWVSVMGKV